MPINFKDRGGAWQPIDNHVVRDRAGRFSNVANEWGVVFDTMGPGRGVSFTAPEGTARFWAEGAAAVDPVVEPDGASVRYPEVFPATDLVYTVTGAGVEELLVLKSAAATSVVSFLMDGVEFDKRPEGLRGQARGIGRRLTLSQPVSFDAAGQVFDDARTVFDAANG